MFANLSPESMLTKRSTARTVKTTKYCQRRDMIHKRVGLIFGMVSAVNLGAVAPVAGNFCGFSAAVALGNSSAAVALAFAVVLLAAPATSPSGMVSAVNLGAV